jgi:hypothetical protein
VVAALRQLVAPHGLGNLAGRAVTPASPVLPLEGAGRGMAVACARRAGPSARGENTHIRRLAKTRMHHVYIVDQHKVPMGVISVSDICRLLDRECCKP